MRRQPELVTSRLLLRPLRLEDAGAVQRLAGDARVADTTHSNPHPDEDGMAETRIATQAPPREQGTSATFAILDPARGLVGVTGLRIEADRVVAELGYWIGVPWWGRGFASEAAGAMIGFGFRELGLDRIIAHHLVRNPASGRVMEKNGMVREGIRRDFPIRGRNEDLFLYGLLRADWEAAQAQGAPPST
ncbi:MAG: GNAT family N-acetyltransferase [Gemmatimonadales bacterium]